LRAILWRIAACDRDLVGEGTVSVTQVRLGSLKAVNMHQRFQFHSRCSCRNDLCRGALFFRALFVLAPPLILRWLAGFIEQVLNVLAISKTGWDRLSPASAASRSA
jgi:hypothetical protein